MRGIQINNFYENHILLSGRKINNQRNTIVQSHRPRPLVIHHDSKLSPDPLLILDSKSPRNKEHMKYKKKNITITTNNNNNNNIAQKQSARKKRISISLEKLNKYVSKTTSGKKNQDYNSDQSVDKSQKQYQKQQCITSQRKLKPIYKPQNPNLGRSKSTIIKSLNQINKSPDKNFKKYKNVEKSKKKLSQRPTLPNKQQQFVKPKNKKHKQSKINLIKGNISKQSKLEKTQKKSSQKKKSIQNAKLNSTKRSKATSVRQVKYHSQTYKQADTYKKKLFQEEDANFESKQLKQQDSQDQQVKKMVGQLQNALNSIGSKKKLQKKLGMILENIKNINENDSEQEDYGTPIKIPEPESQQESGETEEINLDQFQYQLSIYKKQKPQEIEQAQNSRENNNQKHINILQNKHQKRDIHFNNQFLENIVYQQLEFQKDDGISLQEQSKKQQQQVSYQHKIQQIEELKRFKQQSNLMMAKLNKKEKDKKIQELIKIQEKDIIPQEKFNSKEHQSFKIPKQETDQSLKNIQYTKELIKDDETFLNEENSKKSFEQKYPKIQSLKSPKSSLMSLLETKQSYLKDKHSKVSQLVDKMFQKSIVSPKSYQIQLYTLKLKKEEEDLVLKHCKKQVQEFTNMIQEIRKDKEQIQGIQDLLRGQKWGEALELIKKYKPNRNDLYSRKKVDSETITDPIRQNTIKTSQKVQINQQIIIKQNQQQPIYNYMPQQNSQQNSQEYNNSHSGLLRLIPINDKAPTESDSSSPDQNSHQQIPQLPQCQSNKIIKIDNNSPICKSKGFESNLYFIKQYCIALCQFIKQNEDNLNKFKKNLSQPLQFDILKLLQHYRINSHNQYTNSYNSLREQLQYSYLEREISADNNPISNMTLEFFNTHYDSNQQNCSDMDRILEKIFLKSIGHALNQSLNYQKPGSIFGKPLPWFSNAQSLKNHKNLELVKNSNNRTRKSSVEEKQLQTIDMIFGVGIARIIQWGSCLCGFIPDTIDFQNTQIDQQYVTHLRQTRMALLLQKMLLQEQVELSNFEKHETQVLLSLGEKIYQDIIQEVLKDMKYVDSRSLIRNVDY